MSIVFDSTSSLLTEMIRATALRHRILAENLANAETPGYEAQEMTFSRALAEARGSNAQTPGSPASIRTAVEPDAEARARRDGNTVDLDRQMVKLAQNTIWHNAMVQILASRISMLKAAIRDRG